MTSQPTGDAGRHDALLETGALGTPPESAFDAIAALAAEICGAPVGTLALLDHDRVWLKARVGVDAAFVDRCGSLCDAAVRTRRFQEVPDLAADPLFARNPFALDAPRLRFAAAAPVILDDGHAVGCVGVGGPSVRRLTPQQRQALGCLARHAAAELQLRRYGRRALDLAKRLDEAGRVQDHVVTIVSHELRTPLATVRGYLELLLDGDVDPVVGRRFLKIIQRNSERLVRLVDDLLLIARLDTDALAMELGPIDLTEVAERATIECRPVAEHKKVALSCQSVAEVPALGDPHWLHQALRHLIFNGIKFTPSGGSVEVRVSDQQQPTVIVADDGVGIPGGELNRLFERYAKASTSDAAQGPGLGLTIVKAIVDAHRGTITIDSLPGRGTTVVVTVP